jgi:L-rhamnose mutarotase
MEKYAFKMKLLPGAAAEYERRHDAIWPELSQLLKEAGIADYSIHLDEATGDLFAVLWRTNGRRMDQLPEHPVMRKWWDYMRDLMETRPDGEPITQPLKTVFRLP